MTTKEQEKYIEEPVVECPRCGSNMLAEWVDSGYGPFSKQAGPFACMVCGYMQPHCPVNDSERCEDCVGFWYCKGEARKVAETDELLID